MTLFFLMAVNESKPLTGLYLMILPHQLIPAGQIGL